MITFRKDCDYAMVVPTSMGIRMTPDNGQPVHSSNPFTMQVTSAESNVASISSYLGISVKILTNFVAGSPIARMIKDNLAARHIAYEGPDVEQGGPWGFRHQINIADSGLGSRGPRVWNDRAGEVGRTLNVKDFDLDRIFGNEGVQIVHLSGLIGALSPETSQFCLEVARAAKKHGTAVSFDLNHRATFWKGRDKELRELFLEIASLSDILVGNEEDFQLCLGLEGPEAGGKDLAAKIESFKGMIDRQEGVSKDLGFRDDPEGGGQRQLPHLGCRLAEGDNWHIVEPREIGVLDRIGGGDGFVGGMLYAMLRGWKPEKWVQFGWATGAS